jgi:hypothetical protein
MEVHTEAGQTHRLTLNFLTDDPWLTYSCPMTVTSQGDSSKQDTVVAITTTF